MRLCKFKSVLGTITVLIAICAMGTPAFAQAGSTGGNIGKQGKSASGGSEVEPQRTAPAQKPRSSDDAKPGNQKSCGKVAGNWTSSFSGAFGAGDVTVSGGGSYNHRSGLVAGTWTCSAGKFTFTATNGAVAQVSLSSDGKQLEYADGSVWLRR